MTDRRFLIFLVKGVLLLAAILGVHIALEHCVDWSLRQDPRRRLLWDDITSAPETLFLLGDSQFCSFYVDAEAETIWRQLERLTGRGVFPGALNGSTPRDMVEAAKLLAQERRAKSEGIVILDIVPTRFLSYLDRPPENAQNYDLGSRLHTTAWTSMEARILDSLFLRRIEFRGCFQLRDRYFGLGEHRYRVWNEDGEFAAHRYKAFVHALDAYCPPQPFSWLSEIRNALSAAGLKLIIVATPLNTQLVEALSEPSQARIILGSFSCAHNALLKYTYRERIALIDLTYGFPSDCFADLQHTNSKGDLLIAQAVSARLPETR